MTSKLKPAASFNNDCIVNALDFKIMAGDWQAQDVDEPAWNGTFSNQDVGAPTAAGSFNFDGDVYTIQADGADLVKSAVPTGLGLSVVSSLSQQ